MKVSVQHPNTRERPKSPVQIAPMLAVTDRHFRRFFRGISQQVELWTEMYVASTLLHTNRLSDFLDFDASEHPLVCQIGGNDPNSIAEAAEIVSKWGYDEININIGCPSTRVAGKGCFGASLMKNPDLVHNIVKTIYKKVPNIPISIKTRVGVDQNWDSMAYLNHFINVVSAEGYCKRFIMHARKAWLDGINPKKNRLIPPLQYHRVYQLVHEFPFLHFSLNGGITSIEEIENLLSNRWRPMKDTLPTKIITEDNNVFLTSVPTSLLKEHRNTVCHPINDVKTNNILHSPLLETQNETSQLEINNSTLSPIKQIDLEEHLPIYAFHDVNKLHTMTLDNQTRLYDKDIIQTPIQLNQSFTTPLSQETDSINMHYLQENHINDLNTNQIIEFMDFFEKQHDKKYLEGVMIGRAAFNNPCMFACIDSKFFGVPDPKTALTRRSIIQNYIDYIDDLYPDPSKPTENVYFPIYKPILGLLSGKPGNKQFRFKLDQNIRTLHHQFCPSDIIYNVLNEIDNLFPDTLDSPTDAQLTTDQILY